MMTTLDELEAAVEQTLQDQRGKLLTWGARLAPEYLGGERLEALVDSVLTPATLARLAFDLGRVFASEQQGGGRGSRAAGDPRWIEAMRERDRRWRASKAGKAWASGRKVKPSAGADRAKLLEALGSDR